MVGGVKAMILLLVVACVGCGTSDTHAGPSNLRYGFDNWIWGTVGYSGFRGEVGGIALAFKPYSL